MSRKRCGWLILGLVVVSWSSGVQAADGVPQEWREMDLPPVFGLAYPGPDARLLSVEQLDVLRPYLVERLSTERPLVWRWMAPHFRGDGSLIERALLAGQLRNLLNSGPLGQEDFVTAGDLLRFLTCKQDQIQATCTFILMQDCWRQYDWHHIARIAGSFVLDYEGLAPRARCVVAMRVADLLTQPTSVIRAVPCGDWRFLQKVWPELGESARQRFIDRLHEAYLETPDSLSSLSPMDAYGITEALSRLNDPDCGGVLGRWFCSTEAWKTLRPQFLLGWLNNEAYLRTATADTTRAYDLVAKHVVRYEVLQDWLSEASGKNLSHPVLARLASHLDPAQTDRLAGRLWLEVAAQREGSLDWNDPLWRNLGLALNALGASELRLLLDQTVWNWCPTISSQQDAVRMDAAVARPLLCWRIIGTPADQRAQLWAQGLQDLPVDPVLSASKILASVDRLLAALRSEPGSLQPQQVLTDLLAVSRDAALREGLLGRLGEARLDAALATGEPALRDQVAAGRDLERRGDKPQAIQAYRKVLSQLGAQPHLAVLVAMRAVELSLAAQEDTTPADDLLATLSQAKQEDLADEIANLRLRVLLRKVGQAPQAARRDLWRSGLEGLAAPSYLTAAALQELDNMAARTRVDDPALAMDVATDLFLMGTDTASLRAIQQRRMALLASQARWEEVSRAAKLEAVLAAWSCEALLQTITGGADALLAAGMDAQTVQSVVDQQVDTIGGMAAEPAGAAGLLDDSLQAAVLERRRQGRPAPPRQQALLLALSQEPDAAARAGVQVPAAHTGGVAQLESQALLWSLAQGHVVLPPASLLDPRADSQPAAGQGDLVGLRQERLVRWGAEALKAKREAWAATLWSGALAMARDDDQLASLTRAMVGKGLAGSRPKDLLGAMTKVIEAQRASLPRVPLLQRMAEIQYAFRDYRNAGAYLDQAQAACGPVTPPAITAALKLDQAACLINQGQWEAARALLGAQPDPRGTPWQQATAMFLTGLTQCHGYDVAGAMAAFHEGIRTHPQHPFAGKAEQMVARVEACGVDLSCDTIRCSAPEYARQNMEPLRSALTQQAPPRLRQRLELVGELFDRLAQSIDQQQTEALAAMVPPVLGSGSGGGSAAAPKEVLELYHEFVPKFDQSSVGTDLPEEQKAPVAEQYMELSRRTELFVRDRAAMVSALDPARRPNMLALAATVLLLHVGDEAFAAEHVAALPEWMREPLALGELGEVCLAGRRPLTTLCIEQSRTGTTWDLDAQGAFLEGRAMWISPPADRRAQLAALEAWAALADRAGVDVTAMSARSRLCELLGKMGSSGLAAEVMRRQAEKYPQSKTFGQAATLRLKYLCANKNYETLISEATPCLKDERCRDQYPQILYLAWIASKAQGRKPAADSFGEQLLSGYSDNQLCAAVWLDRGVNYLAMGDYEKAQEALRTVLEKFPTSASASHASKLLGQINHAENPASK